MSERSEFGFLLLPLADFISLEVLAPKPANQMELVPERTPRHPTR